MILSDNLTNTEFLYLYVDKFQWSSHVDSEQFGGHPKQKHVYRAILNKDTGGYRIIYKVINGNAQALMLNTIDSENEEDGFVCKIVPLTKANILNYEISEKDLDALEFWTENENKDLMAIMKSSDEPVISGFVPEEEDEDIKKITEDVVEFIACATTLRNTNPLMFDAVHEFMHHAIDDQPNDTSIDTTWLNLSGKFGTGANISKVLEHISIYAGEDRRTNLYEHDLMEAIKHLFNEYTNRRFNS